MISTTFVQFQTSTLFPKSSKKLLPPGIQSHLSSNSLSSSFQSAYWIFHSTETTLLKIHNDLILAMDRGEVTSLILLDLSAAFDTVDHSILLTRLQNWFGLDGLSLNWFHILSLISLSGSLNQWFHLCILYSFLWCTSRFRTWPTPFYSLYYSSWLGDLKKFLKYHLYAGDTQLYISFTPTNSALCLETLTTTFTDILSWMNLNKLLLNPSKTEFLLFGTKQTASQIFWSYKLISQQWYHSSQFLCSQSWLHLWLWHVFLWTYHLCFQILSFSHPRHPSIHHLLPLSTATALANSLVSSKLDYCNSLYSGISQSNLNKLQRIQNSLARVITNTSKYQHITPTLKKLHWLPIKQRIDYKLCLLTYKTLTNQQPTYLYK